MSALALLQPMKRSKLVYNVIHIGCNYVRIKSSQGMSFVDIVNYQQKEMDKITRQK